MFEQVKEDLVEALDAGKGEDIRAFDVSGVVSYADWIVIVTGTSAPHMKHLVRRAEEAMLKHGMKSIGTEGLREETGWILLDFADVVVHIFSEEERDFYQLEKLFI